MVDFGATRDRWVCPNDRELALRAKLKKGWAVKTSAVNAFSKPTALSDTEQEMIMSVIKRAENMEKMEQERVGRLVERLDNMKKNAMGNGSSQCVLCSEEFGILGASPLLCNDCRKAVCTKCSIDAISAHNQQLWLCKICAETRETWKKSGAWFYRGLPKYVLPVKKAETSKYTTGIHPRYADSASRSQHSPWLLAKGRSSSDKEFTDSSDEEFKSSKFGKRAARKTYQNQGAEISNAATLPSSGASQITSSPHHVYGEPQKSPQHRQSVSSANRSPSREAASTNSKDKRFDYPGASSSHWQKENVKDSTEQEDCPSERTFKGHSRKESPRHSPTTRHLSPNPRNEEQPSEEKAPPTAENSKLKFKVHYRKKKRKQ